MAQKVLVQLADDLDGTTSEDVSTVVFGLDGITYEIDLTEDNAERLRANLADYVDAGRRTRGRIKRGSKSGSEQAGAPGEAARVREWAIEMGFELSGRGRIPSHVVEAYRQAEADTKTGKAKVKTKPAQPTTRSGRSRARTKKS